MLISTRIFYVVLSVLSVVLMITFVQNYVGENSLEQIFSKLTQNETQSTSAEELLNAIENPNTSKQL